MPVPPCEHRAPRWVAAIDSQISNDIEPTIYNLSPSGHRDPADDVPGTELRPPAHRRPRGGAIPGAHQGMRGKPRANVTGDMTLQTSRVSVSILGNANGAPRNRLTILAGMLRFLRPDSRKEHHHASDSPKGRLSAASGLDRFKSEVDARSPVASKLEGE